MKKVLARINELRNGQSVNSLAIALKMAQTTLNSYLSGKRKPSIELIKRICANYQVSADWLLGLTDDRGGVAPRTAQPCQISPDKNVAELKAENVALKGEIRGLPFALDSALKGARRAQASASHSRPA